MEWTIKGEDENGQPAILTGSTWANPSDYPRVIDSLNDDFRDRTASLMNKSGVDRDGLELVDSKWPGGFTVDKFNFVADMDDAYEV